MKSKISIAIYFLLFASCVLASGKEYKIISSSKNSLIIEYNPSYDTSTIIIDNEKYLRITLSEGILQDSLKPGSPSTQSYKFDIGVPKEFGNTIQILSSSFKEINSKIAPVPKIISDKELLSYKYEINENYNRSFDKEIVEFGSYGLARDLQIQEVIVSPIKFDPVNNKIRIYNKVVFKINFAQAGFTTTNSKDDFLKEAIINYNVAKGWRVESSSLKKLTVTSSVLSSGKWYRFEAPEEGIYIINKTTLKTIGIDPSTVDPRTIKIYNNGGKVLSENIEDSRPQDLVENAILVSGEEDGKFDDNDYVLFYGRGINFWEYNITTKKMVRYFHNYSKQNYYWITYGGNTGKRMQNKESLDTTPAVTQTTTVAYANWEEDKTRLMISGRLYLGDTFTDIQRTKTYITKLDGLVSGSKITYNFSFANRSELSVPLTISENSTTIYTGILGGVGIDMLDNAQAEHGTKLNVSASYTGALSNEQSQIKIDYEPTRSPSTGYLDYFEIFYNRNLVPANNTLVFYSPSYNGIVQYNLSNFASSDIRLFDVSDFSNVKNVTSTKISGGNCTLQMNEATTTINKYIAICNSVFKTPSNFTAIDNSDLHGISSGAKYIVITNSAYKEEAERYKAFKESESRTKMSTIVVEEDKIFNEFSGGLTDVCAIRDFIKYAYDNWTVKPEYVLLFGDGNYDYKNVEGAQENFIIPYESVESYSNIASYCSDDFYVYVSGDDDIVDLMIGRINVTSASEAKDVVNKIINYETKSDYGLWRNLITLAADDGQTTKEVDPTPHTRQSEDIAVNVIPRSFNQNKIYEANYPTVQTSIGRRKPEVNKAIIKAINDGTIILSWIGHGNPDVWAHEYVFEKTVTIPQLTNDKYFFLTAATCDFGRYDNTSEQSSTELMLIKPDGGSIGTFASARSVFPDPNHQINKCFYSNLLSRDSLNQNPTLGQAYYRTKIKFYSNGWDNNDKKFHLFGDPTLRLLFAQAPASVDSINGKNVASAVQIKALSNVKIEGTIKKDNGNIDNSFNGEIILSAYDSQRSVYLNEVSTNMVVQGGAIYRGTATVTNGHFSTSFVVPKDISYENKAGKIVGYAYNSDNDAICFTDSVIVGGSDSSVVNDSKGPEMEIAFDNSSSENSYLVNPDCVLYVKLKDQTGLNTTGNGVGHTLSGILNGNENSPIDFTNYFIGDLNADGKSGYVKYNFYGLDYGDYKIQVKAWDVFNNYSSVEKNFTVVNGEDLVVRDVVNYPNPFKSNTTFTFQHNLSDPINVKIKIYSVAGRLIKELEDSHISDKFVKVDWDGRDGDGNPLANGIYLYKLIVKTDNDKYNKEVLGKLAIIK